MERCETVVTHDREGDSRSEFILQKIDHAVKPAARRVLFVAARFCFCAFILLTSVYCLLAYIPFTYQWVIRFNLVSWLPTFVKLHAYLYWVVFGMVAATLAPDLKRVSTKRLTAWFLLLHAAAGACLTVWPLLSKLENDGLSFIWSMVWLFPLLWLAAIDYVAKAEEIRWIEVAGHDRQTLLTAGLTSVFVATLYCGVFFGRSSGNADQLSQSAEQIIAIGWSLASHMFAFGILFAALKIINSISNSFPRGAKIEFLLCHFLAAGLCAVVIRKVVLPAIAFNNSLAVFFSMAAGLTITVFIMGLTLRLNAPAEGPVSRGLAFALSPLTPPGLSKVSGVIIWGAVVVIFAWVAPSVVAMRDWDFLLQKLSAIAIWPISFAAIHRLASRRINRQYNLALVILVAGSMFGIYKFVDPARLKIPFNGAAVDISATLDRYSAYDVSFRVIREVSTQSPDDSLYEYLREYTNILPSTRVAPVQVNLVENLTRTEQNDRPNIFIFVVDSLRRDYLSPYNNAVSFTPNIERFARDSIVMENAFTRYGGTALSEPAIWAGAMLLHKQYVLPFYPMNSLQRLLDTDEYQSFISMDPILKELLRPSDSLVQLDQRPDNHNFDFCWSLKELEKRIDERQSSRPIFTYSQPWNIHTHVIAVEGRSVRDGEQFPGFWAPYASRVKHMDECFGEFVNYLKARGLYDNSVVIITSDHGDALGEEGRWGHSYWVYPEIMRIPMIVHLPPKLQSGLTWKASDVAFSTDITPSLYYLMGHKPIVANPLFGRPLFVATEQEHREYSRDSHVLASSYGAAYGVLTGNGRWLFVADGVKNKDHFFDLSEEGNGRLDHFTTANRLEQQQFIRDFIGSINEFYNLKEKPRTAGAFDMGRQARPADEE